MTLRTIESLIFIDKQIDLMFSELKKENYNPYEFINYILPAEKKLLKLQKKVNKDLALEYRSIQCTDVDEEYKKWKAGF